MDREEADRRILSMIEEMRKSLEGKSIFDYSAEDDSSESVSEDPFALSRFR